MTYTKDMAIANGLISGCKVGNIILACSVDRWKYGKLLKSIREDSVHAVKFNNGRRTRYYYNPHEVLKLLEGYKRYGHRHLSAERIEQYCHNCYGEKQND